MMFAEATNNEVITWGFVLVLTTIAANIVVILTTRRTQKREVSFEFTPASKEEFDELKEHNSRIHDLLFEKIGQVNEGSTEELKKVRERMAGVETEARIMNGRIHNVDAKLDRLIERKH